MPYRLIWEPRGVIKHFGGHVSGDELLRAGLETESDARFDDYAYVINDFRECSGFSISPEIVEEIAAIDAAAAISNPHIRIAVLATAPVIVAAATQYAESPLNRYTTRIFATLDEARDWLATPG